VGRLINPKRLTFNRRCGEPDVGSRSGPRLSSGGWVSTRVASGLAVLASALAGALPGTLAGTLARLQP